MSGDWSYKTAYSTFSDGGKVTQKSPPDNFAQWINTQSKGFTIKTIEKVNRSAQVYAYLVLTS